MADDDPSDKLAPYVLGTGCRGRRRSVTFGLHWMRKSSKAGQQGVGTVAGGALVTR